MRPSEATARAADDRDGVIVWFLNGRAAGSNGCQNPVGDRKGLEARPAVDQRRAAGRHAVDEGGDLGGEVVGGLKRHGAVSIGLAIPAEAGEARRPGNRRRNADRPRRRGVCAPPPGDPAGDEGRHGAIGEAEARLGDIVAAGDHRSAARLDGNDRRSGEGQRKIDVVDHQVDHDVDVGGPAGPHASGGCIR